MNKVDLNDKRARVLIAIGLVLIFIILLVRHPTNEQPDKVEKAPTGRNTVYFNQGLLISPASKGALYALANIMNADQSVSVKLIGHSITLEDMDKTLKLSQDFANAVRAELMRHGVSGKRITTEARGDKEPLIRLPGEIDSYYNARQNRVEIIVTR